MSLAQRFREIDAAPENTILIFDDVGIANDYLLHQSNRGLVGLVVRVEDTRKRSGLVVQWRDPIPAADFHRRQAEALWTLEQVLAGRIPRPVAGEINNVRADLEAARRAEKWGPM